MLYITTRIHMVRGVLRAAAVANAVRYLPWKTQEKAKYPDLALIPESQSDCNTNCLLCYPAPRWLG